MSICETFDVAVIGAGPAGLSAAIEAAKAGADVHVFDENLKPKGYWMVKYRDKKIANLLHFKAICEKKNG